MSDDDTRGSVMMMSAIARWRREAAGRMVPLAPIATLPEGRIVELAGRGRTLVHDVAGPDGAPTVILLHALACTGLLTWYPAIAPLAERYRVVTFDMRWHGRGIVSDSFRLADCADDVAAVAEALEIERAVLVGYSMGSLVAQLTWLRHRQLVDGLVLAAGAAGFRPTSRERLFHEIATRTSAVLRPVARGRASRHAGALSPPRQYQGRNGDRHGRDQYAWARHEFRSTSGWAIGQALAAVGRFDSTGWVGDIDVPAAVVVTTRDRAIAPARQRDLARRIRGATVYEAAAGHVSCVVEADEFVPVLLAACASVVGRTVPSDRATAGSTLTR